MAALSIGLAAAILGTSVHAIVLRYFGGATDYGMAVADLPGFVLSHPFVSSRMAALLAGGELTIEGDHIVRPGSLSSVILRVGEAHRLLRGAGPTAE